MSAVEKVQVIDSHTGGEPTRVVVAGGPELGRGTLAEQLGLFRERFDRFRSALVNEPRGSDVLVGALIVPPFDRSCAAGAIFFNNVGYLGMCGHGTIGLVTTLAHLGRIEQGEHRIETAVGVVTVTLHADGSVSVLNVPSYRTEKEVNIQVPGIGTVTGDVAWGGNWFFLMEKHGQALTLANVPQLTDFTSQVRHAVNAQGFPAVDHIELFGPPSVPEADARNFVLCPGKAYDRSPCGTGTSAKLACLFSDGKIREGQVWRQESITGSVFEGSVRIVQGQIVPIVKGRAFITAESTLILEAADPLCWGMPSSADGRFGADGGSA